MYHRINKTMLAAIVLLISASLSLAETTAPAKSQAVHQKTFNNASAKKGKSSDKIKLVDINSADKAKLMKLSGINEAYADKIIAGRPYGSKSYLMTRNILPAGIYAGISRLIIARQPYKDAAKNAEYIRNKK